MNKGARAALDSMAQARDNPVRFGMAQDGGGGSFAQWAPPSRNNSWNDDGPGAGRRLTTAVAWIEAQEARDEALGATLFGDPAWSILLQLYIAHHRDAAYTIETLARACRLTPSAGARWIALLEKAGLACHSANASAPDQLVVSLTATGKARLDEAIDRANESNSRLGIEHVRSN